MIHVQISRPFAVLTLIAGVALSTPAAFAQAPQTAPKAPATAPAPAQAPRPAAARPAAAKAYALAIKNEDGFINVALKARKARVADIAKELGVRLRASVVVGPDLAQDVVTLDMPSSPLEMVLQALAPRVLVDYEVRQDARPLPLAIHLLAPTDTEPTANIVQRGASQGVVISGHTEETASDGEPVTISGDQHQLSIAAKNQPLALVAMMVADVLGVTLDLNYPAGELVVVDISKLPAEDAVLSISPNVRLHVRVDLSRAERTPIKMLLTRTDARAAR